jgi:hypothetical protein
MTKKAKRLVPLAFHFEEPEPTEKETVPEDAHV